MAMFAVMSGNKVINVIIADTKEIAQQVTSSICIEYTKENPAAIDWVFNPELNVFITPEPEDN